MASYSALVATIRNIGTTRLTITQTSGGWTDLNGGRSIMRIRSITNPHIVSEAIGGFISADFVIQPEVAAPIYAYLRKDACVWMFDGQTPVFYGQLDSATLQNDGSVLVTLNGWWQVATGARMREVWDDWDMSRLQPAPNNNKAGQVALNSDGTITLSFPQNSNVGIGDKCSVDYFLFNEAAGTRDNKLLTGFDVDIPAASFNFGGGNLQFNVFGKTAPDAAAGDTLLTATTSGTYKQGAVASSWPSATGYRVLRFTLYNNVASASLGNDRFVTLDRIRVSTREGLFNPFSSAGVDTAALARDVFNQKSEALDRYDIPLDFWRQQTAGGRFIYGGSGAFTDGSQAGDPITGTGTCLNSGVKVTGFNIVDWTAPTDILIALAQMDGSKVGFYFPINVRSGYFFGGPSDSTAQQWVAAPPQLVYEAWSALSSPDYFVQLNEGAVLEQDSNEQPLVNAEYVNYTTLEGRQASVVSEDSLAPPTYAAYSDWLTANGYRRAEDYTIGPSIGATDGSNASTAASIGAQLISLRNQPHVAGKVTISKDGVSRYPIRDANGAVVPKLALVRPGVVRVVDLPQLKRWSAGYATHIEWYGETFDQPETLEITLGSPGQMRMDRRLAQLQWRSDHSFAGKRRR